MDIFSSIDFGEGISTVASFAAIFVIIFQTQKQIKHDRKMRFSEKLLNDKMFNVMYNNLENTLVNSDGNIKYGVIEMEFEMSDRLKFNSHIIHYLTVFKPKIHIKILEVLNDKKLYYSLNDEEKKYCDLLYNDHRNYYLIARDLKKIIMMDMEKLIILMKNVTWVMHV